MAEILLHHARLPAAADPLAEARWLARLPPERAARVARLRSPSDRLATLLGIALLHDCAAAAGLSPPGPQVLVFPERGRPHWPGGPGFSISHAGGHVACAIGDAAIGIGLDIEARSAARWSDLRLVSTEAERALHRGPALGPAALWTAKEAVLKAAGTAAAYASQVSVQRSVARLHGRRYLLRRPWLSSGLACTVALTVPARVRAYRVSAADVLGSAG